MTTQVIQVIQTDEKRRGKGVPTDPIRRVAQYFTLDGDLLAEVDDHLNELIKPLIHEGTPEGTFIGGEIKCDKWNHCVHGAGCMYSSFPAEREKTYPPVIIVEGEIKCLKFKKG